MTTNIREAIKHISNAIVTAKDEHLIDQLVSALNELTKEVKNNDQKAYQQQQSSLASQIDAVECKTDQWQGR